jgi:hypothetical protein
MCEKGGGGKEGKQTCSLSSVVIQNWRSRKGRDGDEGDTVDSLVHFRQGRGVKRRDGSEVSRSEK